MNFYNVIRLAPGRAGMTAQINGILVSKIYDHAWFYCTMKANIFPLGNGWEYGSDIAEVGIPSNSLFCQGLTPSVTLPLSASAAQHTNMLEVFSLPRQKKKSPSKNVICCLLGRTGKINGKE